MPDVVNKAGQILDYIYQNGFLISQLKMCLIDRDDAWQFYAAHKGEYFME